MAQLNPISGTHTTNSSLSTAVSITRGTTGGTVLTIQVLTQNCRATIDGTTPTASTGVKLVANGIYQFEFPTSSTTLKIIEETASASIQYWWSQELNNPVA